MALVELENVDVYHGDLKALDGVTCVIDGGAVGLLGPNGAGKTTLLETLLGFNRAARGTVKLFGLAMPRHVLEVRQQLGFMPEQEAVSPKISAVAFLVYCGQLFGMKAVDAMKRTHEVLNYVGLGESRYRKMETYSTGMLQRAKLAQALIHDPKLLLLDEPTNGLDPDSRIEMLELIREISAKKGVTVVLSSHLLPDVQHVCDRAIIINKGKVARQGTIREMTALQGRQFEVRVRDNKDAFMAALEAVGFTCKHERNGVVSVTQPEGADKRAVYETALACDTQVRHFRPARKSLAEAFMHAVEETEET